jgi:hypothetical protein
MSQTALVEDALSPDGLSAPLAEATGHTPEEIRQGAEELEISRPKEATVDDGE